MFTIHPPALISPDEAVFRYTCGTYGTFEEKVIWPQRKSHGERSEAQDLRHKEPQSQVDPRASTRGEAHDLRNQNPKSHVAQSAVQDLGNQKSLLNFTAVLLPYKVDLEKGRAASNESRTSLISVFAVMGGMGLLLMPIIITLVGSGLVLKNVIPGGVLAIVYAGVVYAGTTLMAGQLLESRGPSVLAEISQEP